MATRGKNAFTPEEIEALKRRINAGETRTAVANELGVHVSTVCRFATPTLSFVWTDELSAVTLDRLGKGESVASVARGLGISDKVIGRMARKTAPKATVDQLEAITAARGLNKTAAQIAVDLKIPVRTVEVALGGGKNKVFSTEERHKAIKAIEDGELVREIAKKIGASDQIVKQWHTAAVAEGNAKAAPVRIPKRADTSCTWINRNYPDHDLEQWRGYASEWLKGEISGFQISTECISTFIDKFIVAQKLPTSPAVLLTKGLALPDFYAVACQQNDNGIQRNNRAREFINWVLKTDEFSMADEETGERTPSPRFRNPIAERKKSGDPRANQSDKTVMPYALTSQLRSKIVGGPNFRDWTWVHSLSGKVALDGTTVGPEWFIVREDQIDINDPDCVWQRRTFANGSAPPVFEMWSPVRWVCLLMKSMTPGRTGQWRMCDSGESDTTMWRNGKWVLNKNKFDIEDPLQKKKKSQLWRQGVLRQLLEQGADQTPILYFNSNKTQDKGKRGTDMGMDCPWIHSDDITEDPYYWLEKLRNWQEKYNPIKERTSWKDIPVKRQLSIKHEDQKAQYPDTCFLFRTPENPQEAQFPSSNGYLDSAWQRLLAAFEEVLATEGQVHADGSRILLVDDMGRAITSLHGMRVSLITHFIIDGDMPPALMMKIVGHATMIMTIYYTKPGMSNLRNALVNAHLKLDANKEARLTEALKNMQGEQLRERVVFNAEDWTTVVPVNPDDRSPVGWLHMHDGICLAGGNTGPIDGNSKLPGCHNGGPLIQIARREHGPVPGGVRNCPQCRFNCAGKEHGYGLQATHNNRWYHLQKAQEKAIEAHRNVQALKLEKSRSEGQQLVFTKARDLKNAEKVNEQSMVKMGVLAVDIARINRMIERIKALPDHTDGKMALAANGDLATMHLLFEEIDSKLLVLSNICEDVEFFPELDPGVAVFERSHLLDKALEREGKPAYFALLTEADQLKFGNAFMQALERQVNPGNPLLARREVVQLIDDGHSLDEMLGGKLDQVLTKTSSPNETIWLKADNTGDVG